MVNEDTCAFSGRSRLEISETDQHPFIYLIAAENVSITKNVFRRLRPENDIKTRTRSSADVITLNYILIQISQRYLPFPLSLLDYSCF